MNGALQHQGGKDCALCAAHSKAAARHKTAPQARRERALPWIGVLLVSAVIVPFIGDAGRWVALGLCLGVAAGAAIAWLNQQTHTHFAAATLAGATDELKAEADQRVAMVIRQFEWAVNDVANLRDALKHAQDGRATAEASEHRVRSSVSSTTHASRSASSPRRWAARSSGSTNRRSSRPRRSSSYRSRGRPMRRTSSPGCASRARGSFRRRSAS